MLDYSNLRSRMVDDQIIARGVKNARVIEVMRRIPRHMFVSESFAHRAYGDHPLPIQEGQTISQPYMVAFMTELLDIKPDNTVLEIGTGSGYQSVILAELAEKVYTIDRYKNLVSNARAIFNKLNYHNIVMKTGDGTLGWKAFAPFDRILVTAGAPAIPEKLINQLADNGRMILPVGGHRLQNIMLVEKINNKTVTSELSGCVFVPLVGKYGWNE